MANNRFGLTRNIPHGIKTVVRRRCGFGCVICGAAIITYEHFDPAFIDARRHDPAGITLLCGQHQLESTKGLLSKMTIKQADQNPRCRAAGYAKHLFDLGGSRPKLFIGGNNFSECGPRIVLDRETIFEVLPPERKSNKWRLSAKFREPSGKVICEIKENELLVASDNFDVQQTAAKFRVSLSDGTIFLELEIQPPNALLLTRYTLVTSRGKISIGEQIAPSLFGGDDGRRTMLVFETDSSRMSFVDSAFVSSKGIFLSFKDGALTFGSS